MSSMEWFEVSDKGKLLTYSKLKYAPVGFDADLPYFIAVVDYGEYKVFGRIAADVPEEELKIGLETKIIANKLASGHLNYVFVKA